MVGGASVVANSGVAVPAGVTTTCVTAGNSNATSQPCVWPLFAPPGTVAIGAGPLTGLGKVPAATTEAPLTGGTLQSGGTPVGPPPLPGGALEADEATTVTPVAHDGLVSEAVKLAFAVEPTT